MDKKIKRLFIVLLSVVVLVIVDRLAKIWAENTLPDNQVEIIPGALRLELLPGGNKGAAWGMMSGHQMLFIVLAVLVCIFMLVVIYNIPFDKKYTPVIIFMTCIISGGVGNMIDRAVYGTVTDFISFYIINFPYFNVADMYVSVATTLFVITFLFCYKEEDIKTIEDSVKATFKIKKK
ncbi:MAG: signal peptidase II [Lachnospiraceae bacterium]|nr:signal peptidase II [Lachnospiraceae bacterium]